MGWISHDSSDASPGSSTHPLLGRTGVICCLLLLASAINYMDRQTLASVGSRITQELELTEKQYGTIEKSFGWGFAVGSLVFGILVDYVPVRWMYPLGLFLWSATGFATGFVRGYDDLVICRGLLGFFEAAHWPCGLKTTQSLLESRNRGLGNSVLQSGTSIGACITPLLMLAMLTSEPGSWRFGFQAVGFAGLFWIVAWFLAVRGGDLKSTASKGLDAEAASIRGGWGRWLSEGGSLAIRRLLVVLFVLLAINVTWQILRAWLPKVLQQGVGYTEKETLLFTSVWYIVTDIGCLGVGALTFWLGRRGWSSKGARVLAFGLSAILCAGVSLTPFIAKGPLLLGVLLIAGAGALGLFPMYYSFTQDVSRHHQGKVTGVTGILGWAFTGFTQEWFGALADRTKSYDAGLIIIGCLPLFALFCLILFWPRDEHVPTT